MAIQVGHDVKRRATLISLGMREEQSADETGESAETIAIQFFYLLHFHSLRSSFRVGCYGAQEALGMAVFSCRHCM